MPIDYLNIEITEGADLKSANERKCLKIISAATYINIDTAFCDNQRLLTL